MYITLIVQNLYAVNAKFDNAAAVPEGGCREGEHDRQKACKARQGKLEQIMNIAARGHHPNVSDSLREVVARPPIEVSQTLPRHQSP